MKKILAILLLLCSFGASAKVSTGKWGDNITYTLDTETGLLTLEGTGSMCDSFYSDYLPYHPGGSTITRIIIGEGITRVGDYCFYMESSLTEVSLPSTLTSIGGNAFCGCTKLASINFPASISSIGSNALHGTQWLDNQVDGLIYAGSVALLYKGTMPEGSHIDIRPGTVTIGPEAFCYQANLVSVSIPSSVRHIDAFAFWSCYNLTTVQGCNGLQSIGVDVLEHTAWYDNQPFGAVYLGTVLYCYKGSVSPRSTIKIKQGTLGIAQNAFFNKNGLVRVNIPSSVTRIESWAFACCQNLTSVTCEASTVPWTHSGAFYGVPCENVTLTVPQGALDAYQSAVPWSAFGTFMTGITNVHATQSHSAYNLAGQRLQGQHKGINIIKMVDANGNTKVTKVLVK